MGIGSLGSVSFWQQDQTFWQQAQAQDQATTASNDLISAMGFGHDQRGKGPGQHREQDGAGPASNPSSPPLCKARFKLRRAARHRRSQVAPLMAQPRPEPVRSRLPPARLY